MEEFIAIPSDELNATLDRRRTEEDAPSTRSEAQRDRDRVLYSSALLRLGHVTQVAAPEVGHIFHSRLTHSMKVGQVARGLAQRQKALAKEGKLDEASTRLVASLDEDATEAAALAHDLGHPPYGHIAEKVLDKQAKSATFEGNPQSFRIVTRLALRSAGIAGLNLTKRTLNGLLKYPWLRAEEPPKRLKKWGAYDDGDSEVFHWARDGYPEGQRTLEAWLMDWADDVTYAVHDLDDFFRAGLIRLDQLTSSGSGELEEFQAHLRERAEALAREDEDEDEPVDPERFVKVAENLFSDYLLASFRRPFRGRMEERVNLRQVGSTLIGNYIAALQLRDAGDGENVVLEIKQDTVDQVKVLKELTWFYVINGPSLSVIQKGQTEVIETLYHMYREAIDEGDVHIFPPVFAERLEDGMSKAAQDRVVIDLIAGMTEGSAAEIFRQSLGVTGGSLLMRAAGPT